MNYIKLISIKFVVFLFICLFSGCNFSLVTKHSVKDITKNQLREAKSNNRQPILEIWKEEEGSVAIRGEHLHFRLFDDGFFEFDYLTSKKTEPNSPRLTFSHQRTPLTKLSEEEFSNFKSILKELTENKDVKKEYPLVSWGFDVIIKLKILLIEDDTIKKKIITNNSDTVIMKKPEKFPDSLSELVKEIHLVRDRLTANQKAY